MNTKGTKYNEVRKSISKKDYRKITIRTTDGNTIVGKVNLGVKERVSDLFTRTNDPFIIMTDFKHKDAQGEVLFINKHCIIWVEPED